MPQILKRDEVMMLSAKILAMSTIDILCNPDLLKRAKREFEKSRSF